MKVKAKFDFTAILGWLFEHGEKLVFGVVALVFLMFVYSGLTRDSLDASKQPDRLQQVARQVETHVTQTVRDEKSVGLQVVDYLERAKRREVPTDSFATHTPLNNPIFDPKRKRDEPKILNAEEIRIAAGFGSFAIAPEGAKENAAGGGQAARGGGGAQQQGGRDRGVRPTSGATLKPQPWVVITALVPVDKQAKAYSDAFSRAMGADLLRDVPQYDGWELERAEINPAKPDQLEWTKVESNSEFEKKWEAAPGEIVVTTYVDPRLTGALGPLVAAAWDSSVTHPKIPIRTDAKAADKKGDENQDEQKTALAGYKLLRAFDYTVEPNRKYRYRLKLKVKNPNYRVDKKYLKNPDAPAAETRLSDEWSEPTAAITVPSGSNVLAGTVVPKAAEPEANLLLTAINPSDGIPTSTKVKVYRGSVANKKESKVLATDPRSAQATEIEDVNFQTGLVVLDIFGGETVSASKRKDQPVTAPGEVLLLDADGNLVVHSQLGDSDDYKYRQPPEASDSKARDKDKIPDDSKKKKSGRDSKAAPKAAPKAATKSTRKS